MEAHKASRQQTGTLSGRVMTFFSHRRQTVSASNQHPTIPPGSGALFFIQTFSTLGFAVLYSTLVLYATKRLGFSESQANAMMGVFGAFNYGLHLFGGYLGGRYLSNRNLFGM